MLGKFNFENLSLICSNYLLFKSSTMSSPLSSSRCIAKKVLLAPSKIANIFTLGMRSSSFTINLLVSSTNSVATLALGSRPRQGGCKVAGQVGDPGALHMLPGVQRMWGNEPSHSQVNSHVGSWSPERTPESSERDCRGQISSPWVLHIIGKVLKCRCPKWPHISHLDVCSPSYGQKKGRESKLPVWEKMTPDQKKSRIDPIYLASGNVRHIVEKLSTRATTLLETSLQSKVCRRSYAP